MEPQILLSVFQSNNHIKLHLKQYYRFSYNKGRLNNLCYQYRFLVLTFCRAAKPTVSSV